MCGYFGVISDNSKKYYNIIKKLTNSYLFHRGPDDSGILKDPNFIFCHRRLAIIDIENNKQPYQTPDKNFSIIFNGEIYNYKELRDILKQNNFNFTTDGDTEVLLKSYIFWGESFIDRIDGMFSFVIWDRINKKGLLYRDRLGVKLLYYSVLKDNSIIFSNEIKPLINFSDFSKNPNIDSVFFYLLFYRHHFNGKTMFENISVLQPGHYIKFSNNRIQNICYWDLKEKDNETIDNEYIKDLIDQSVKKRMISDVSLGAFLSGGIDSTILVSLMKKYKEEITTYSIGFEDENEFKYSNEASKFLNTKHNEILLSYDEMLSEIISYINNKSLPMSVPNEIPISVLSKILKKDLTVVLSGEGADEVFGGYGGAIRIAFDYERFNKVKDKDKNKFNNAINRLYGDISEKPDLASFFTKGYRWVSAKEFAYLFGKDSIKYEEKYENYWRERLNKIENLNNTDKIFYVLQKDHLPGLLERLDFATMQGSVESRCPFTDYKLIEEVWKIPYQEKISWKVSDMENSFWGLNGYEASSLFDDTKKNLREMFKNMIPLSIYSRKKKAFPVPLHNSLKKMFLKEIKEAEEIDSWKNIFSNRASNLVENLNRINERSLTVFMLGNLAIWWKQNFSKGHLASGGHSTK